MRHDDRLIELSAAETNEKEIQRQMIDVVAKVSDLCLMEQRKTGRQTNHVSAQIYPDISSTTHLYLLVKCCRQQQPTCSANHVLQSRLHLLYPFLRDMRNKNIPAFLHSCTSEISHTHNRERKKRNHLFKFEMQSFTGEDRKAESQRLDMV